MNLSFFFMMTVMIRYCCLTLYIDYNTSRQVSTNPCIILKKRVGIKLIVLHCLCQCSWCHPVGRETTLQVNRQETWVDMAQTHGPPHIVLISFLPHNVCRTCLQRFPPLAGLGHVCSCLFMRYRWWTLGVATRPWTY